MFGNSYGVSSIMPQIFETTAIRLSKKKLSGFISKFPDLLKKQQ